MARLQSVFAKSAALCTRATIPRPASSATIVASGGPFLGPNAITEVDVSSAWTRIMAPFPQKQPQYRQHDAGPFLAGGRRISAKTVAKQQSLAFLPTPRAEVARPVAVGTRVTSRPPHRSVHETFPHTAPTSGPNASSNTDAHAAIACDMLNPAQCPQHALMGRMVECLDRALNERQ